ncbi:MAG: ISLre2 family transposase [Lachnospiraceae bacterium]|nr:ISLre2 family transposase [Lachnospiraceae bacterium]
MINSIQHFCQNGVKNVEKVMVDYSADMTKIAEMVQGVTKGVVDLGLSIIAEEWENYDEMLRSRKELRPGWYIVRRDETTLLTSLGSVTYHKTLFRNKFTGEHEYLLDRIMGIEKHARMTEDAEAKLLEEAVQTSYRKGGESASISNDVVSKETVMNKIHPLKFPRVEPQMEKKALKYLYIDADEDHVSLQYINKKGDIKKPRTNTIMPKLIYVYEGITNESGRNELINKKHFGGVYEGGKGIEQLWEEVAEYIESSYDTEELVKIYINGDGAAWIKSGQKILDKAKFVLDRFHMHKYIIGATSHLLDSMEDARSEIYRSIYEKKKYKAEEVFEKILSVTETESKRKTVEAAKAYILGNWAGIMQCVRDKNKEVQCSAEGHISHVFADRMSSRPLGWSRIGVDKMSRLRIYEKNGGNMLELVRFQKEELPLAAGCEEVIYSSNQMFLAERKNRETLGALADVPVYSIPYPQIKKMAALKNHIWGL